MDERHPSPFTFAQRARTAVAANGRLSAAQLRDLYTEGCADALLLEGQVVRLRRGLEQAGADASVPAHQRHELRDRLESTRAVAAEVRSVLLQLEGAMRAADAGATECGSS